MKKAFLILGAILCALVALTAAFFLGRIYTIRTATLLECSNHHAAINYNGNEVYYAK